MTNRAHSCRSCRGAELERVLSLGRTPLANALLTAAQLEEPEPTYALDLLFCPKCATVQIGESVAPEVLFEDYPYFSSFSDTMVEQAEAISTRLRGSRSLNEGSLVVELASNDGYLLQFYKRHGVPVLGIEPAKNVASVAQVERGIPTICEFFTRDLAVELAGQGKRADVIHGNNVLAHVPDVNGFVAGIAELLKDTGVAVIEVPYVREMVDRGEFDTIYHEHLFYFSLTSLDQLFTRNNMILFDVERLSTHGGSLRVFAARRPGSSLARTTRVGALLEEETRLGLDGIDYYRDFSARVQQIRRDLRKLVTDLKASGKQIAAYGASAKGSTLLNYCGIGSDVIDFVVDRSIHKRGRYTPGTHLPIVAPDELLRRVPDYVLLLAWNLREEILEQQSAYRSRGGRFIVPVPKPEVV